MDAGAGAIGFGAPDLDAVFVEEASPGGADDRRGIARVGSERVGHEHPAVAARAGCVAARPVSGRARAPGAGAADAR